MIQAGCTYAKGIGGMVPPFSFVKGLPNESYR